MNEFVGMIILGILGFFVGGAIGVLFFTGFFPAAWYGLIIGLGGIICPHMLD